MRLVLLLALSLVSASACAQSTWHNLHFGQSRDDVRAQLSAQNMPVETSQEGTLQSTTDFELALPGLRYTLPMLASFHFNDAAQLSDVTLTLDLAGMHRYWATLGSDDTLLAFATEHLTSAISGRYGAPIYRSPACDTDPKTQPSFCLFSWHGTEQTIEMERHASARGPRLLIRYQPLATDL